MRASSGNSIFQVKQKHCLRRVNTQNLHCSDFSVTTLVINQNNLHLQDLIEVFLSDTRDDILNFSTSERPKSATHLP